MSRLDAFLALFDLEEVAPDRFRGPIPADWPGSRLFGGQVAAQALRAAQRTVSDDRAVHSLHAYFLRPGRPNVPIAFFVERVRDGRSFTSRRVAAVQEGETIFDLIASFHRAEDGPTYQLPMASGTPGPEDVERDENRWWVDKLLPIERRPMPPVRDPDGSYRSTRAEWIRVGAALPDDPSLHACAIVFVSDMGMVGAVRVAVDVDRDEIMFASLDHAVWFHRPVRADEWLLYDRRAVSADGARGLSQGLIHTRDGVLGATVTQEALIRPVHRPG